MSQEGLISTTKSPSAAELATVRSALRSFGLEIPEPELVDIAQGWDIQRTAINMLYEVAEARYAEPALRFRADAVAVEWLGHTQDTERRNA